MIGGRNQVTLTFDGDSDPLERVFARVGDAARRMTRRVSDSSRSLGGFVKAGADAAVGFGQSFSAKLAPMLASPMSVALVGAATAAAPAMAAAVTAGLLMAVGGGVLIAGIVTAARDPAVAAAFTGLGTRAKAAFANFGTPFKAPLIRAADTFGDALERMAPALNRMGAMMAPIIDVLAPALAQMFEKALPGIEKAVAASIPLFITLAEHAPAIGEATGKFFEIVAKGAPAAVRFLDIILKVAEVALPLLGQALRGLSEYFAFTYGAWLAIFNGIKAGWNGLIGFFRGLPARAGAAFSGMFDGVKNAFRSALNWVIDRWNNFHIPGLATPFGTLGGFNTPNLPRMHSGGVVPGPPGSEVVARLQAGERVTPAGASNRVVLEVRSGGSAMDNFIAEMIRKYVRVNGGNVQTVLGT
ncbi:MAG TPA: hypothetical protein VFC00_00380 [Micromonosporaceae bacterium]|nr:hypothetical protein [Micromonosporaceae bacterium]